MQPIEPALDWAVWQHPVEAKHAKNTLRLLSLCWPQLRVWTRQQLDEALDFEAWLAKGPVYLVFPADKACLSGQAIPVTYQLADWVASDRPRLLFIDATWRKATAMLLTHPRIAALPRLHLTLPERAHYIIRKSPSPESLSTFEAVVGCLEAGGMINEESARLWQTYHDWQASLMAYRERS
ncbi:DTW domain-containing protein [Thiomicrospira aerophila]|uniref:DTW domain-containing protein n=1 Tax=Thiomicrospira aerophila TaxID=92245 RepID=UPI00022C3106|nr:tRNA-uridine aminocarboxypropyltransferase [Thiomicrospira aerophila]